MSKKTKVVFLISNNFRHDNRTRRQAMALIEAGYDVTVLCPLISAKLPTEELVEGITVKRVLEDWLPIFPKNKQHWEECKKYLRAAEAQKADIFISKDLDTLFYGWRAAKKHKAKLVYNADEYWQDLTLGGLGLKTKVYYKVAAFISERFLAPRADLVTTVNEALAKKLKRILFLRTRPTVITNAPEAVTIIPNKEIEKNSGFSGKSIVLYLGIFSEGRGLENLVKAAKLLPEDIAVALVGYGNLKDPLNRLIKAEGLSKKVKILDPVPYQKMLSYAAGAKLGIIPILPTSISHKFCLPNKFFEYILAGLPICASDLPVLKELIDKYEIGETYQAYNIGDLAKTITEMLYNKDKYSRYKANLKKAGAELNWGIEKEKFVKAIRDLSNA